jgi:hypothetical protein
VLRRWRASPEPRPARPQANEGQVSLRLLERLREQIHAPSPSVEQEQHQMLTVAADGSWFCMPGGERTDLSRRASMRGILAALCQELEREVPRSLNANDLIEAGWPGQRMLRSAALNRLHVALATLRSLGLRDALQRDANGYRLAGTGVAPVLP